MENKKVLRPKMFIRTKDGYIRYIIDIIFPRDKNPEWFLLLDGKPFDTRDLAEIGKNIAKYSFDLIELIEVGDYVNGSYVLDFKTLQTGEKSVIVDTLVNYRWGRGVIPVSKIESIITKEQVGIIKYEVYTNG